MPPVTVVFRRNARNARNALKRAVTPETLDTDKSTTPQPPVGGLSVDWGSVSEEQQALTEQHLADLTQAVTVLCESHVQVTRLLESIATSQGVLLDVLRAHLSGELKPDHEVKH